MYLIAFELHNNLLLFFRLSEHFNGVRPQNRLTQILQEPNEHREDLSDCANAQAD